MTPRLLVCAGEASGDRLAADVLAALGPVDARGIAGPALRARGVVGPRAEDVTAVGLVEAIEVLPAAARALRAVDALLDGWRPDAVLTVDAPGLMLRIGRRARARGIPVAHLVSPQVWAWRPGRVVDVAAAADVVLCVLPFEPAWYRDVPVRAVFVGHPAAARAPVAAREPRTVLLGPGSRPSELRRHWPVLRDVAAEVARRLPDASFVVPVAPTVAPPRGLSARYTDLVTAASVASAAVITSGTATVELAALGVPMTVIYAVHPATWALGRALVRVRDVALPNVVAGRRVVPEHLQHLDPGALADEVVALLGPAGDAQRAELAAVVAALRPEGGVDRIAGEVRALLTAGSG